MATGKPKTVASQVNKIVKAACEKHAWPVWSCYNDARKTTRRLSYKRNGYRCPEHAKQAILDTITADLATANIEILSLSFEEGMRWGYGPYDYVSIVIPK